jgi:integrase
MARRRTKRSLETAKRCACRDRNKCEHDWWLRVKTANGKRQRINLTQLFPTDAVDVAAAKAKDLARKGLLVAGSLVVGKPEDTRPTLGYVADRYVEARGNKKNYYIQGLRLTEVAAASGVTVKLQDKPIDEVTTQDIKHAEAVWRRRKTTGAQQGKVAIRHLLQAARHLFNWGIKEGYATRTPFLSPQGVTLISVKATAGRTRRLEPGEEDRLLKAADPFTKDLFVAILKTGCRPGELRTLQWREVKDKNLVVLATKAKDREERKIPIKAKLRKILDGRRKGPDGNDLSDDAYVFGTATGELMSKERVCGLWRKTCAAAKVTNLHLHDLRAEFAATLHESKVPLHLVRDALGHSSVTMTDTYLRSRVNSLDEAYDQLEAHENERAS